MDSSCNDAANSGYVAQDDVAQVMPVRWSERGTRRRRAVRGSPGRPLRRMSSEPAQGEEVDHHLPPCQTLLHHGPTDHSTYESQSPPPAPLPIAGPMGIAAVVAAVVAAAVAAPLFLHLTATLLPYTVPPSSLSPTCQVRRAELSPPPPRGPSIPCLGLSLQIQTCQGLVFGTGRWPESALKDPYATVLLAIEDVQAGLKMPSSHIQPQSHYDDAHHPSSIHPSSLLTSTARHHPPTSISIAHPALPTSHLPTPNS
ncbi:hypothetical protein B7494_g8602 [Chlorociboria aeruginascens]|nr:hypothetical protein B7494_g8602 [Chlorociboria aeruginascens]